MLYESFYSSDIYVNEGLGVYAGFVCHENSFCDCMPIWNEKKTVALLFFGENFSDLELFDELKAKHHKFDSSNAGYIVHMYEEKGLEFLRDLNGWFSGLLIDLRSSTVILFNDRFGMQRVFCYEHKDAFYFASEAKALLGAFPELRVLDVKGVTELLTCGCVLEDRTLFKNVSLLPHASAWIFGRDNRVEKSVYFTPDAWEDQPWLENAFFTERLHETLKKVLPRYFRTNQSIGISLTGGLDTRMLVANAEMPAGKYPCYTFGGMYRDCYDIVVARQVAAVCQQTHQTIPVGKEFLDEFPRYAERTVYISDGYLDVSGSSEVYANRLARDIAPVRLTGNFGGEVTRGIRQLQVMPYNQSLFDSSINQHVTFIPDTLERHKRENVLSFILFNEAPWCGNLRLSCEQSQVTMRTPYLDNDLVALMYRMPPVMRGSKETALRLISDGNAALAAVPTDRGFGGNGALSPTLRHAYREFLFKAEYAYNYGMPQWLARFDYTFKPMHFERLFLGRHKFCHYRLWYRDHLADYVKSVLLDDRTLNRPYLNRKAVEQTIEAHTRGYRNHTTEISQLLTLELIERLLIEQ
jgi:asparagine synthase (glutamine-hydrolysing)